MKAPLLFGVTLAIVCTPALAQDSGSTETPASRITIEERIREGLNAADAFDAPREEATDGSVMLHPPALSETDASLAATGSSRLRTTLDAIDIGQRIDKG